jgi:hypothetical protein
VELLSNLSNDKDLWNEGILSLQAFIDARSLQFRDFSGRESYGLIFEDASCDDSCSLCT